MFLEQIKMRPYFLFFLSLSFLCACTPARSTKPTVPYVENKQLSILAGEEVYVEVVVQNNTIVGIKKVSNVIDPNTTMTFAFMNYDNGKSMTLSAKNPLTSSVKYHIDMVDHRGGLHNTSSCPVLAGKSVFEIWPHPIPEIRITNFHFTSEEEKPVCIY